MQWSHPQAPAEREITKNLFLLVCAVLRLMRYDKINNFFLYFSLPYSNRLLIMLGAKFPFGRRLFMLSRFHFLFSQLLYLLSSLFIMLLQQSNWFSIFHTSYFFMNSFLPPRSRDLHTFFLSFFHKTPKTQKLKASSGRSRRANKKLNI